VQNIEKIKVYKSIIYAILILIVLWSVKLFEVYTHTPLYEFGVYPLTLKGLRGVLTAPLIHADFSHLISNSFAMFFLSWALFYFYRGIAIKSLALIYVFSGFWTWIFAREAYHIGASGLIYGLSSFLFFSGIFRKHAPLIALSLTVVFLYGGIVWGVFPIKENVSWETHLSGLVAGIVIAFYYKHDGPQKPVPKWDDEDDVDVDDETPLGLNEQLPESNEANITYHYKKNADGDKLP